MQETVHADALLQADEDAGIGGHVVASHVFRLARLENERKGTLVAKELDRTYSTYYIDIGSVFLIVLPQALAARVVGVEQIVQGVLVHHHIGSPVGIVGQFGGGQTPAGMETVGLEEMGVGQERHDIDIGTVLCRVALRLIGTRHAAMRAGIAEAHQGRGLLYIGVLPHTVYKVEIRFHQGAGFGGQGVVARRRGLQHIHGNEAETVRIVAQGEHTVVRHHDDGVEDGP